MSESSCTEDSSTPRSSSPYRARRRLSAVELSDDVFGGALREVIEDADTCLVFRNYLREHDASAHLSFWFEVERYKRVLRTSMPSAGDDTTYSATPRPRASEEKTLRGSMPVQWVPTSARQGTGLATSLPLNAFSKPKASTFTPYSLDEGYRDPRRMALDIYAKYISSSSPYTLPVAKELRSATRKEVNKLKKGGKEPPVWLFDEMQLAVWTQLEQNQLEGFKRSRGYQAIKGGSLQAREKLIQKHMLQKKTASLDAIQMYHQRQAKRNRVFGTSLEVIAARQHEEKSAAGECASSSDNLPHVVRRLIEFIMSEGLDCKGLLDADVDQELLKRAKQIYNSGSDESFFKLRETPELAFALLRLFLRKMPHSLIPDEYYHDFVATTGFAVFRKKVHHVQYILKEIPVYNRELFRAVLFLCSSLLAHNSLNEISLDDIAGILNPNIVWKDVDKTSSSSIDAVHSVLTMLVENYNEVFKRDSNPYGEGHMATVLSKRVFHKKSVQCILMLDDAVWTADSSGQVHIWNKITHGVQQTFESGDAIIAMHAHDDKVFCSSIERVHVRAIDNGALIETIPIFGVCCFATWGEVVLCGGGCGIALLTVKNGKCSQQSLPLENVYDVRSISLVEDLIWAGCSDGFIRIFDVKSWETVREFKAHDRAITAILYSHCNSVWTACDDGSVSVFDSQHSSLLFKTNSEHSGRLLGLAALEETVWSYGWDRNIVIWNAKTRTVIDRLSGFHSDCISGAVFGYTQQQRKMQAWTCSFDRSICVLRLDNSLLVESRKRLSSLSSGPELQSVRSFLVLSPRIGGVGESSEMELVKLERQNSVHYEEELSVTEDSFEGKQRFVELMQVADPGEIEIMFDKPLGRGSIGTTYLGKCRSQTVAVKLIHERKFDDETMMVLYKQLAEMQQIVHPSLVLYMGASHHTRGLMLVYEYMSGGSLLDVLQREQKMSTLGRMTIAKNLALALSALHENVPPIVHEGLRLSNILVDQEMRVKISDLGLASVFRAVDWALWDAHCILARERHSKTDGYERLPWTLAPEVLVDAANGTSKSDVYSYGIISFAHFLSWFGIILMLLYSNKVPRLLGCNHYEDVVEMVGRRGKRIKVPEDAPEALGNIIRLCMEGDPQDRPTLDEILINFDDVVVGAVVRDDVGRKMWKKAFGAKTMVPWIKFLSVFKRGLSLDLDNSDCRIACLYTLLCSDEGDVSLQSFADVTEWFGPLSEPGILDRIQGVLQAPWFHGPISMEAGQKLMLSVAEKKNIKKGLFLVRFSRSTPGSYAISTLENMDFKHYLVTRNENHKHCIGNGQFATLGDLVRKCKKPLKFLTPCEGSQYEELFKPTLFQDSAGYEQFQPMAHNRSLFRRA